MNCTRTQIRNPKTNRCVKASGKLGMAVLQSKCKSGQIVNPPTRRCVSKSGTIGKRLLSAKCKKSQVLDPRTGRCKPNVKPRSRGKAAKPRSRSPAKAKAKAKARSRSPAKAKARSRSPAKAKAKAKARSRSPAKAKAKAKARSRSPAKAKARSMPEGNLKPGMLSKLRSKLVSRINKRVATVALDTRINNRCNLVAIHKRGSKIGSGAEGAVYKVVTESNDEYVLKVSKKIDANFKVEAAVYKRLSDERFKHAPIVIDIWSCKKYGYILMEGLSPIVKSVREKNYKDTKKALDLLHQYNIVFPDAHDGNFMRRPSDGSLVIIDYGWAYHFTSRTTPVKNRHRDLYGNSKFTWEQVMAWEQALVADSFGTRQDRRRTEDEFARVMPASA
jgi:hypothetical protein